MWLILIHDSGGGVVKKGAGGGYNPEMRVK